MGDAAMRGRVGRWALVAGLAVAPCAGTARTQEAQAPQAWHWRGAGSQVYRCGEDAGRFAWTFVRPDAVLSDAAGVPRATHGAGPHWRAEDGSVVRATVADTIPAPGAGDVPWLVLRASSHEGGGRMARVAFVLRTDTRGGAAPAGGCDAAAAGQELRVPYTASYTFVPAPG